MARSRKPKRPSPGSRPAPAPVAPKGWQLSSSVGLVLAGLAVLLFYMSMRSAAPLPWSYDEYYHLGLAREMRSDFRIESFRWTPFSIFFDHFADKEPLFHVLLMPLAGLPLERAGMLGTLLGQVFLVGAFAFVLWKLGVPRAPWFLFAVAGLGPMFALRVDMCRPHIWQIGFSILVIGLLAAGASWKVLVPVCALFGLTHTGGWIAIAYAALFAGAGFLSRVPSERKIVWQPAAATAGGWLLGQLVHPNVPENFRLFWIQNFVVPFQSTAGSAALRSQIGNELTPPEAQVLFDQWPAFIAPAIVVLFLLGNPRLRTRVTVTAALIALGFLFVGSFFLRRFFELGAPLSLLALALVLRERAAQGLPRLMPRAGPFLAGLAILLGGYWTYGVVRAQGFGRTSPPREVAQWLGEHGLPGERVFTAQWADSAPLFYSAPQLQSLVVLDPTFFYVKDPGLFDLYVRIVQGQHPDPARVIRERFGARWVTLWKVPTYRNLAMQLVRAPGVVIPFNSPEYVVVDLGTLTP
ncbi:MAG TPA: hypothetical protein VF756_07425 [Thermoanaerobaculia bacterium]